MSDLTLAQIANRCHILCNYEMDVIAIRELADEQYRRVLNGHQWSFVKYDGVITTVAEKSAGTVTATNGLTTITGSGTSFASTDANSLFVIDSTPYLISAYGSTTSLTLSSAYVGTTGSGKSYAIRRHQFDLATDVESILQFGGTEWALDEMTEATLMEVDPNKRLVGPPTKFIYVPSLTTGITRVELSPVPTDTYRLPYHALKRGSLTTSSQAVSDLADVILNATLQLVCLGLYARTKEKSWQILAASYKQEFKETLADLKKRDRKRFGTDAERPDYVYRSLINDPRYYINYGES